MHHILILDDNEYFAKQLERTVDGFDKKEEASIELAITPDQALTLAKSSSKSDNPFTIFLVDQRLGAGMDGIATMRELLAISPDSDAVILTGFDNSEDGIRAYDAGAARYLSKTAEPRELIFVLNDLARSRREKIENKWRMVFSEMMETALQHNKFKDVAKVVVDYSIQLGFKRAHLFWAPKESEVIQRNTFVGIECSGNGCVPSFSEIKFFLPDKKIIGRLLHSRDAVFVNETDVNIELKHELKSIGFQFPAGGWWILPLWGGQELLGALTLDFGETLRHLSMHERTLLDFFSRQVSVALEHAGLYSREKHTSEEIKLLQRASVEMLRIANESEDDFWLTILTIATANFGLGFNRALLLLTKDNHRILYGRAGVGDNNTEDAERKWEHDEERQYGFDSFLDDVIAKRVQTTPLQKFITGKEIPVQEFGNKIGILLESGEMIELSEEEASAQFPESIKCGFTPSECALIPVRAGNNILGFVIVDNKHNHKPLNRNALGNLQTLLANAGLVWETLRQRAQSEELLDANYEILGGVNHQPLKETLERICKTARVISQADWAIIYPFRYGLNPNEIEIENFGYDGELKSSIMDVTTEKIRVGGVSTHVLRKGKIIVEDIDKNDPSIGKIKLSEHHFIKVEDVKALIGVAVSDPYSQNAIGILYLDYRKTRTFSESDIHHAKSLASLAAVAISNSHEIEEVRQRRQFKLATEIAEAVGASLNLEATINAILSKLKDSFKKTRLCVLLYDKRLQALKFAPATLKFYKVNNKIYAKQNAFHLDNGTITCRVAKNALTDKKLAWENIEDVRKDKDYLGLNPRVKSEFCISLLSTRNELLGVLALEREQINGFNDQDIEVIKTVALHISMAIERAQQSEELEYNSTVAAQTSWAASIAHEINNEVGKILNWAYLIRKIAGENREMQEYAKNIEESVSQLSISNPWANTPSEAVEIDVILNAKIQQLIMRRSINVDFHPNAPGVKVMLKTGQFQHILKQLLNNAARAMQELNEKKIFISTQLINDNTTVEILFQDFGPGISEDKHASAFLRPFTTKGTGGFGLLFIRQMVDDIGGEIMLLPYQKGKGATFSIHIPISYLPSPKQSE
jgi:GAF domain-containing protein